MLSLLYENIFFFCQHLWCISYCFQLQQYKDSCGQFSLASPLWYLLELTPVSSLSLTRVMPILSQSYYHTISQLFPIARVCFAVLGESIDTSCLNHYFMRCISLL